MGEGHLPGPPAYTEWQSANCSLSREHPLLAGCTAGWHAGSQTYLSPKPFSDSSQHLQPPMETWLRESGGWHLDSNPYTNAL